MGTSAQSTSCSPLANNNELGRHGATEKEPLCAPGDSPVPGAKITPLVLFINSGGTACEWHTDVGTAGSASPACLGPVPQRSPVWSTGGALQCLCLSSPFRAGETPGGCFKIKTRFGLWASPWPSPKEPPVASIRPAVNFSAPRLVCSASEAQTEPGAAQLLLSSSGKSSFVVCVHTRNEMMGDSS